MRLNGVALACEACSSGMFSNPGSPQCTPCSNGSRSSAGQIGCQPCGAGRAGTLGFCSACGVGEQPAGDRSRCVRCDAGHVSPNGTLCRRCVAGGQPDSRQGQCVRCGAGRYSQDGVGCLACANVSASAYSRTGSVACSDCASGTRPLANRSGCSGCPVGRFSAAGTTCDVCDDGAIPNRLLGARHCVACVAGRHSNVSACEACVLGTYSLRGRVNCTSCANGSQPTPDHSGCISCGAGRAGTLGFCSACGVGEQPAGDRCVRCAAGHVSELGLQCTRCDAGRAPDAVQRRCHSCASHDGMVSAGLGAKIYTRGALMPLLNIAMDKIHERYCVRARCSEALGRAPCKSGRVPSIATLGAHGVRCERCPNGTRPARVVEASRCVPCLLGSAVRYARRVIPARPPCSLELLPACPPPLPVQVVAQVYATWHTGDHAT